MYVFGSGGVGGDGRVDERIVLGLYQPWGDRGSAGRVSVCGGVGVVGGEWVGGLDHGRERLGGVICLCEV